MSEPKPKSFEISKRAVWEAWLRVRANRGAAGVDEQSIEEFERGLSGNLYKLWNRLSAGSYFPPPVRAVEIPKRDGSPRMLGVPTVADRIAQTVVAGYLEPGVEPFFHPDSYGYRPGRSALDAVGVCRERCWREAWVLDLDIRSFFDSVPWDLVLKAVARHTDRRWVLLYVERWLKAPLQREDGSVVERDRGTPQGSSISPLLANMFLHYAFDAWMAREYPGVRFERYCDDVIVHARSERDARQLRAAIASRLAECGLELNEHKTRIVYCKDSTRRGSYEHEHFDFLGYTFRPRLSKSKSGGQFVNFLPAVSDHARKRLGGEIRRWRLHRWSGKTLTDLARSINVIVQGWANYYGRFYPSELVRLLKRINEYLVRWARWKYKRLRRYPAKARRFLAAVYRREPGLFAHWRFGARPDGWTMGAG
ncbi:MAG: group II intron reverse transcriptase/maturase [Actinobacteria bacterium]|nr:group II intron reverse transcriptase/maturase [Actinomycetota bacterium]MCA1700334.1 group II intron reverse transcriptase/maturase [Actinomycetota bacterium]